MKKSQMCFPFAIISALITIATCASLLSFDFSNSGNQDGTEVPTITSVIAIIFSIISLIRAKVEKENPSTLRSTGIVISCICILLGGAAFFLSLCIS